MKILDWLAALVLFFELPVPLYWLFLHPVVGFWRRRAPAAYFTVASLSSWGLVTVFLFAFHGQLFASEAIPTPAAVAGIALLLPEIYLLSRVKRELGGARLMGKTEISGGGELATGGLYARMRHPRYAGMMSAVLGACLLAGSVWLWVTAAAWWLLALLAIRLEERELRARFGAAYEDYSRRVPRFLRFRFRAREQ